MDTLESLPSSSDKKAEGDKTSKKKKAELAAKRRARVMAQMSAMQKNFIQENAELFENVSTELVSSGSEMDIRLGMVWLFSPDVLIYLSIISFI